MRKREKPNVTTRSRLRSRIALVTGLSGLSGVGAGLWLLGPAAGYTIGLLLVLANFVLAWTAIFITRKEPSERLVNLIKAVRRR